MPVGEGPVTGGRPQVSNSRFFKLENFMTTTFDDNYVRQMERLGDQAVRDGRCTGLARSAGRPPEAQTVAQPSGPSESDAKIRAMVRTQAARQSAFPPGYLDAHRRYRDEFMRQGMAYAAAIDATLRQLAAEGWKVK
jgi:hypothetical protein